MNIKRLLLSWVAFVAICVAAVAQTLPTATTITDGQFAADTKWYTLHIGSQGYLISDQGTADHISLSRTSGIGEQDLWCFVGDNTTGYTIYNKRKGAQFALATPSQAAVAANASQGLTAYTIVKSTDTESMGDYRHLWKFSASTYLNNTGFFMHPADDATQRINNRNNVLAYWTGGADAGSTVVISPVEQEMSITPTNGTMANTTSNTSAWKYLWTSTSTTPTLTLNSGGANNMRINNGMLEAFRGTSANPNYTIAVPSGYVITGYTFQFKMQATTAITVTSNGVAKTSTASYQTVTVDNLNAQSVVAFTLSGSNQGIILDNFKVTVQRVIIPEEPWFEVFSNKTTTQIPYRIPAIATAQNGNLIAVADYRYTRQDIGMGTPKGQLDIRARIFDGQNWGEVFTLAQGNNAVDGFHKAFGDPCLVADRESAKVLLLTCAGDVSFFDGTRDYHQGVARFISENNGAEGSWSKPQDITEQFYAQLDGAARGPIKAMFIGSGKIHQSRYIKKGDYYRLYVATIARDKDGVFANYVYFSDDFGVTWTLLGDKDTPAVPSGDANEPKVEELPDGSVVISSRPVAYGAGRIYNIFKFTDSQAGKGYWGTMAYSNGNNKGTSTTGNNSCNGEIIVLPVKRVSDGKLTYVAFQSVPLGPGRSNVGIYYKELDTFSKYSNATTFSANWDGVYQASYMNSAYSTMTLLKDGTLGFLFEEDTYGVNSAGGYNIVYKNYTIEKLTGGKFVKSDLTEDATLQQEFDLVKAAFRSDIYGTATAAGTETNRYFVMEQGVITTAESNYTAATYPSGVEAQKAAIKGLFGSIEALHAGVESGFRKPKDGDQIFIQNSAYTNLNLAVNADMLHLVGIEANDHRTVWKLEETATKGVFYIYNPYLNRYIAPVPGANETTFDVVAKKEQAGRYEFVNPATKLASISQFGATGNNTIHFKSTGNPVRWVAEGSPASQFIITVNENPFDEAWIAGLRTDLNTAADIVSAASTNLQSQGANIGTALGQFHVDEAPLNEARQLAASSTSAQPEITKAIKNLAYAVGYNTPKPGFYRFKGSVSGKYIDAVTAHASGHAKMTETAGQNADGIFYLTHDNQLLSYSTGLFLANSWGVEGYRSAANTLVFDLPNGQVANQGKYTLYTGSWLYDNGNATDKNWLDRNSIYAANNCDWVIEAVNTIPVQISSVGLTTLYAPVDLQLPEGVKAYTGAVNAENSEVTLTQIENGVIPAFTPVVIEGTASTTANFTVVAREVAATEEKAPAADNFFAGSIDKKPKTGNVLTLQNYNSKPGFYKFTGTQVKGFRAYVQLSNAAPTQGLSLNFGTISAIDAVNTLLNEAPAAIYDLQGRRHNSLQKGINIVNGKKIFVQ